MPTISTIDDVSNIRSIGAAVTANAGAIAIQNINGALKQVDDQGTVTSLGGSSLPTGPGIVKVDGSTPGVASIAAANVDYSPAAWAQLRSAGILAIDPTLTEIRSMLCNNVNEDWETAAATNTGVSAILNDGVTTGGVIQVKSGTTANSLQILRTKDGAASIPAYVVPSNKGTHWGMAMRIRIQTTPDANTIMRIMTISTSTVDICVGVRGATSTANFSVFTVSGASHGTDSTQALPATGVWFNLGMVFDGTTVWAVYNDVKVTTGMTNLSDMDTAPGIVRSFAQNGATAANQEYHIAKAAIYLPPAG